jgi:hypothetical protein
MELYEDDGVSLKHSSGESAKTKITTYLKSRTAVVEISKTAGDYEGRPHARSWSFIIALRLKPAVVKVNGEPLPQSAWCWDSNRNELSISKLKGEKLSMEIAI